MRVINELPVINSIFLMILGAIVGITSSVVLRSIKRGKNLARTWRALAIYLPLLFNLTLDR